ncbi:MAG: heparan-alpha-glucosaminide N-acetyltransferase domain-containing protein [Desulfobacteraceae bacterium]
MALNRNRIEGFDLARAIALMGMVVVNFTAMMDIEVYPMEWIGAAVDFIFGRAATVFVMLAGASLSLVADNWASRVGALGLKSYLIKRCILLLVAGMVLSYWWEADILHFYALFVTAGAWIADCSTTVLKRLTLASAFISIPVCAALTVTYDLMDGIPFVDDQRWSVRLLLDYITSRYYSLFPWITFFLFGMLLGRLERADGPNYHRWAAVGALVCIVIEFFSAAMMLWVEQHIWDIEGNWWIAFLRSEAFPVTPLFMFSSGASALAVIGMCRLVLKRRALVWCLASLLAFGRISLTLYVSHLIFGFFIIHWIIKNNGALDAGLMLNSAGFFCCAGILSASLWLRWFRRGPLEALFYRLAGGRPSTRSRSRPHPGGNTESCEFGTGFE